MSAYSEKQLAEMVAGVNAHLDLYLSSGGARGHIIDMNQFVAGPEFATMLLLRTTGRKTGRKHVTPLLYGNWVGHAVIGATLGGSDKAPNWYHNIAAGGETAFQIATEAFLAEPREAQGEEYDLIWDYMTRQAPVWNEYKAATTRRIPLVMLKPVQSIPVFTA
jgi:deazaflavin-dependent oxidoreductase (nitroreductase family)